MSKELDPGKCHQWLPVKGFHRPQCSRPVKVIRNGLNYCTIHDPEYIKTKQETQEKKRDVERQIRQRHYELQNARIEATKGLTLEELRRVTPDLIRKVLAQSKP